MTQNRTERFQNQPFHQNPGTLPGVLVRQPSLRNFVYGFRCLSPFRNHKSAGRAPATIPGPF